MRHPTLLLPLVALLGCGTTSPPIAFDGGAVADGGAPVTDGGVGSDGGASAGDGGGGDGGAVAAQDCPAPADGGTPPRNLLVMNPRTGQVEKSLDLSCFAENADGLPRPFVMAQAQGKVYVTLQDFDRFFSAYAPAKVLVLDPATDRVIRRIDLGGHRNPNELRLGPDGRLYAVSQGILGLEFPGFVVEPELSGGIDVIDPSTDTVVGSVDDDTFGGNVTRVAFADQDRAWAVVAEFDQESSPRENRYHVKAWSPRSRTAQPQSLYQSPGAFLSGIEYDPVTATLYLAEADFVNPRLVALRGADLGVDAQLTTALALPPQGIAIFPAVAGRSLVAVEPDFAGGVGLVETVDLSVPPPHTAVTRAEPTSSDPVVRVTFPGGAGTPLLFVVNRFGADNVQWLDPESGFITRRVEGVPAQWSTGNGSNPQDVLAISDTKIYVTLQN